MSRPKFSLLAAAALALAGLTALPATAQQARCTAATISGPWLASSSETTCRLRILQTGRVQGSCRVADEPGLFRLAGNLRVQPACRISGTIAFGGNRVNFAGYAWSARGPRPVGMHLHSVTNAAPGGLTLTRP